jgi:uncharacterized membrane protein
VTDPSRPRERTRLAWWRTALASTVVTLLGVRLALRADLPVVAAASALAWVTVVLTGRFRARRLAAVRPPVTRRAPYALAAAVVGYAVVGAVVVALHLG